MKTILQHNPAKQDNVEAMADALVESMRFADPTVDYPDISKAKADDGVPAEWFHKAYAGITGTSELTAILQYTQQRMIFDQIGETFLGIALTEMKHYDRLGDFIDHIGAAYRGPYFRQPKWTLRPKARPKPSRSTSAPSRTPSPSTKNSFSVFRPTTLHQL